MNAIAFPAKLTFCYKRSRNASDSEVRTSWTAPLLFIVYVRLMFCLYVRFMFASCAAVVLSGVGSKPSILCGWGFM
jgi:hypothetical protein